MLVGWLAHFCIFMGIFLSECRTKAGREELGFYFHSHIIFWIVLNVLFTNMHISYYKAKQACGAREREEAPSCAVG